MPFPFAFTWLNALHAVRHSHNGGAHTTHTTRECCKYEKDGTEKSNFRAAKKGDVKNYPVNQNFAQLIKKIEKLEKALKKSGKRQEMPLQG